MSFYGSKKGKYKYIFGPVPSRRLGLSLGVDIVPYKTCTLDCIYCEIGTTKQTCPCLDKFDPAENIIAEFKEAYEEFKDNIDIVTITGSGEPTLNKDLPEIFEGIKAISNHPVAILTNGTTLTEKSVSDVLKKFDVVVPSLDAADEATFNKINKPDSCLKLDEILESFIRFSREFENKLFVEILLVKGINDSADHLSAISDILSKCRYTTVQLNTVFRPSAYTKAEPLNEKELLEACIFLNKRGVKVEPVGNFIKSIAKSGENLEHETLLSLIEMRPCSVCDLSAVFGKQEDEILNIINNLKNTAQITALTHGGEIFYFSEK